MLKITTLILLLSAATVARAQFTFTDIANSTQTAPGGGPTFTGFSAPIVSGSGDVVFRAFGGSSDEAYYGYPASGGGGRLLRRGDAIPAGAGGGAYNGLNAGPTLADNGTLTFTSTTTGGPGHGLYQRDSAGNVTSVMQRGQAAAGGTGTYNTSAQYRASDNGSVVFQSTITSGSASQGLFRRLSGGSVVRLADTNSAAPGGGTFTAFAPGGMNSAGQSAFFATITGDPSANAGIYQADSAGVLSRLVAQGQAVPGFSGAVFNFLTRPALNETGQVAFRATGDNGAITRQGIFLYNSGVLSSIAVGDQAAPGGGTFDAAGFSLVSRISDTGQVAFRAGVVGSTSTSAIFLSAGGSLSRVLGVGDALFGSTISSVGTPTVDDQGGVYLDYSLASGQSGILRATVSAPEPTTLFLFGVTFLSVVVAATLRAASTRNFRGVR